MKTILAITIVTLLCFSSASISPDNAEAIVNSYVGPRIISLVSQPGISRAGGGIQCYDKYLPKITEAAETSKTETATCISNAAASREDELNKVKRERETLDGQVTSVSSTLSGCLAKTDDLEYLKCLRDSSANLQSTIKEVGDSSTTLSNKLSASYKNIDSSEDTCIKSAIAKSKTDSDALLAALQNCLMNGLDDGGSDGGDNGGSDGGDNGGSDGGDNGGSDGGDNGGSDGGDNGGSDGGDNGGSDGGDNGGSDNGGSDNGGSDNGGSDNGGSDNGGSDNEGSDNGGSDNGGSDNGDSNGGDNGGSDNGSDSSSNGGSDSGSLPNDDLKPQEDTTD